MPSMRAWEQPHSSCDHFLVLKFPLGSAQIMNDPCLYDDDADDFQNPPFELAGQRHQQTVGCQGVDMALQRPCRMPKFYGEDARELLQLCKGFSVDSRDNVMTALAAYAIKHGKPFKLNNKKMKVARSKERNVWVQCYSKTCKFCIHFKFVERRADVMDTSHCWTIVDEVIPHTCMLNFSSDVAKKAHFSPFPKRVLAMALLERLSAQKSGKQVPSQQHAITLRPLLGYSPSMPYVRKLKTIAMDILHSSHEVPRALNAHIDSHIRGMVRLGQYVDALREVGHQVSVTTQTGAELRLVVHFDAASVSRSTRCAVCRNGGGADRSPTAKHVVYVERCMSSEWNDCVPPQSSLCGASYGATPGRRVLAAH